MLICALGLVAGCELREVVDTNEAGVFIAEVYLRTDAQTQLAILHHTRILTLDSSDLRSTQIEVTNAAGEVLRYFLAPDTMCAGGFGPRRQHILGGCYASDSGQRFDIVSGQRYNLRVRLGDGGEITGSTTVPSDFTILRPTNAVCALPPATRFEIAWTTSPDAWVYASESNIRGLRPFLAGHGIDLQQDPLRLFGLSVSSIDTTISFPNEFGLFDRFDDDLTEALVLIQTGLPAGTVTDVVIAAADRNYVNWERGGNFNPSGVVRIGNLRGDGTGVFGSLVAKQFQVRVGSTEHPPC